MPPVTGVASLRGDAGGEQVLVEVDPDRPERVGRVVEVANRLAAVELARRRDELGVDAVASELLPVVRTGLAGARSRAAFTARAKAFVSKTG